MDNVPLPDPVDDIPSKFYDRLQNRILRQAAKNVNDKDCWNWLGTTNKTDGYGHMMLSIKGDRMTVNSHRAAYIAFHRVFLLPFNISHLCHNRMCVNPVHLSHEPSILNQKRKHCKTAGKCEGHMYDGIKYDNCIL